jgi:hypothetical protein
MAEDTPLVPEFNSAVISYASLMEELTNWVGGNDTLRLDMNLGSNFSGQLQYAAGAKYGALEFIFEQLRASGVLEDFYTRQNVNDALTALMENIAAAKQEVKDEMERVDAGFRFWREQIRDIRGRLEYVEVNRRRKALAGAVRRSSPRPEADVEVVDGSEEGDCGGNEGGGCEDDLDPDLVSTLREVRRRRKEVDADGEVAGAPFDAESAGELSPDETEVVADEE